MSELFDPAILPMPQDIVGPAKDRLVAVRPTAEGHVDRGAYAIVFDGWRAQSVVARRHLVDQVKATRLGLAEGQALTELAAGRFDVPRAGPARAVGEVILRRPVVHYVRAGPVDAPDGVDEGSLVALLAALRGALGEHLASVHEAAQGTGAHREGDPSVLAAAPPSGSSMALLAAAANAYKLALNRHVANQRAESGAALEMHFDADGEASVTTPDAVPSAPGQPFGAQTAGARQGLLRLVNAMKRAMNAHGSKEAPSGVIGAGVGFRAAAIPTARPPVVGAQYVVTHATSVALGAREVRVPIEATTEGTAANLAQWAEGGPELTVTASVPLPDRAFQVADILAAGGAAEQSDRALQTACAYVWTGRDAPLRTALLAGVWQAAGVEHVAVLRDVKRGAAVVYAADAAWASSGRWRSTVLAFLREGREAGSEWQGFGCRVIMGEVVNRRISVDVKLRLRESAHAAALDELRDSLVSRLRSYFDERPDWYVWSYAAIRAVCAAADRARIVACTGAVVRDDLGRALSEPIAPAPWMPATHWWLDTVRLTVAVT